VERWFPKVLMAIVRQVGNIFPHPMNSRVTPGSCQKFKLHIYLHRFSESRQLLDKHGNSWHFLWHDPQSNPEIICWLKVYPTCLTPSPLMNGLHFQLHPMPSLGVQNYTNTQTRLHSSTLFKILLGSGFEIKCVTRIPQSSSFCQT
jgi:hypothetical protein